MASSTTHRLRAPAKKAGAAGPKKDRPRVKPGYVEPMKALGVGEISGSDWLLEIKYDGYRALAILAGKSAELWSRNEKPLSARYPEVTEAVSKLKCESAVLDGEIAALDEKGRPAFQLLQARAEGGPGSVPLVYFLFDLLHLNGVSLLEQPIEERKALLEKLLRGAPKILRFSPVFEQEPAVLLEEVRRQGLEGIVGKRRGSSYESGRRSGAWVKKRISFDQEFVIGGYTRPQGGRSHFGALVVGYYDQGELIYAGKVGTGFSGKLLRELSKKFQAFIIPACPFANLPAGKKPRYGQGMTASAMRQVTWLKPSLVAQIKFSEWTQDGMLRQPVFLGLREDKRAEDVVRESGAS
jgi:bifunctional non-homologous end joining protein LigD